MFKETLIAPRELKSEDEKEISQEEILEIKKDYLMSVPELDRIRMHPDPRKLSPEKKAKLEGVNRRIKEIIGEHKGSIFETIIKEREGEQGDFDKSDSGIDKILENYSLDAKLIELPDELLAEILRPLNSKIRQVLFVQRDKKTISDAIDVYKYRMDKTVIAYHVSDGEIKDGKLIPGSGEDAVYFSTDIKRLFNNTGTKNLYAFRVLKSDMDRYRYGALDCFGKMRTADNQGVEIEDAISLYSKGDHSYRNKVLDSLGADFATNYHSASDRANAFMKEKME